MKEHQLKRELKSLYKSLDFFSKNFLNGKKAPKRNVQRYFSIYQQLGLAWEFLGLQCKHWDGYKTAADKKEVCKICSKVSDAAENYYLLPKGGPKRIGFRVVPNLKKTFPTKEEARILDDTINFHGARLNVDVSNSYKSTFLGEKDKIIIAADRIVTLRERGIRCSVDQRLIDVKIKWPKKRTMVYGGFPWEIKRKHLKNFPVIFEFDDKYRFLGLTILH